MTHDENLSYIYFLLDTYILVYCNNAPEKNCIITKYIYQILLLVRKFMYLISVNISHLCIIFLSYHKVCRKDVDYKKNFFFCNHMNVLLLMLFISKSTYVRIFINIKVYINNYYNSSVGIFIICGIR